MKKRYAAAVLAFTMLVPVHVAFAQADTLVLLHLNDTHSMLAPTGPRTPGLDGTRGGIARAATIIGSERQSNKNVLVLHAGDFSIGDLFYNLFFGTAELQILGGIGLDAIELGNHEFDLGPMVLKQALDTGLVGTKVSVLSANLDLGAQEVKSLKTRIQPFTTRQYGSLRVGIFGLLAPETNLLSRPAPAHVDTAIIPIARAMVDSLRARHCTLIICLSHLGFFDDERVASAVRGINIIAGGHDHYLFPKPRVVAHGDADTTWIVQVSSAYLAIGKMILAVDGRRVRLLDYTVIPLDQTVFPDPRVASAVDGLIARIESVYGRLYTRQIGFSAGMFQETAESCMVSGNKDTPIGNLVSDAFRALTGTPIAVEVGGSTAQPLYPGPLVAADVFRVVGYGFNTENGLGYRLATFSMRGADLLQGIEYGLSSIETRDEFLLQASGLTYAYDPTDPAFSRLVGVKVGDVPLNPSATYMITSNEFVPSFLGAIGIRYGNLHVFHGDTTEFQVLVRYIAACDTIRPRVEGRVVSTVSRPPRETPIAVPEKSNRGGYR